MSQLPESLRCRRLGFNEHGRREITVTPHLSEAIKQKKVVSNSAKAFNEVRSHIKFGMLSKISFNLPVKTSVIGGPAPQKYPLWLWWCALKTTPGLKQKEAAVAPRESIITNQIFSSSQPNIPADGG